MELPDQILALGDQLRGGGEFVPDPALFNDANVFAAERQRVFARPWTALDHETRFAAEGHYFRCDAAPRALIVTRENGGRLHALRNLCLHAGYPVCDAEEGAAERLICPYHGWEYTLDGRLVEPELSARIDPARLLLPSYPIAIRNGLVFADLSGVSPRSEEILCAIPNWLADAKVTGRARYTAAWNWKFLQRFVLSHSDLFCGGSSNGNNRSDLLKFNPLSMMVLRGYRAALLRLVPRFAEQTDLHVIQMTVEDAAEAPGEDPAGENPAGEDPVDDALRRAELSPSWFDRGFAAWYWSMMSET